MSKKDDFISYETYRDYRLREIFDGICWGLRDDKHCLLVPEFVLQDMYHSEISGSGVNYGDKVIDDRGYIIQDFEYISSGSLERNWEYQEVIYRANSGMSLELEGFKVKLMPIDNILMYKVG